MCLDVNSQVHSGGIVPNRAVVLVISVAADLSQDRLSAIMCYASCFIREVDVSEVTLLDGCRFLSYMEGPMSGVSATYLRCLRSTSHTELVLLGRGRIGPRRLAYWPMCCQRVARERCCDLHVRVRPVLRSALAGRRRQ
ncbi:BLUF domain-containing protein [Stenotrophomonas indicatrix]|uniref:BLUF domain-containing protein n=1 Tax=Stenotrophomonas indicatrix TaxID=2045451 RepID=UPI003D168A23